MLYSLGMDTKPTTTEARTGQEQTMKTTNAIRLRASTKRVDGGHDAALRRGSKLVWSCGHSHHTRDDGAAPAKACAWDALNIARGLPLDRPIAKPERRDGYNGWAFLMNRYQTDLLARAAELVALMGEE